MMLPYPFILVTMYKYYSIPVFIKDTSSILIIEFIRSAYFDIDTKLKKEKIRRPNPRSIILIPDKHRLFKRPTNPKFFQNISDFPFRVRHPLINRLISHRKTSKQKKKG